MGSSVVSYSNSKRPRGYSPDCASFPHVLFKVEESAIVTPLMKVNAYTHTCMACVASVFTAQPRAHGTRADVMNENTCARDEAVEINGQFLIASFNEYLRLLEGR